MKLFPKEVQLARNQLASADFEGLSEDQLLKIKSKIFDLENWLSGHIYLHYCINLLLILFLLLLDFFFTLIFPGFFLNPQRDNPALNILVVAVLVGLLKGHTIYGIINVSIHEWAAHNMVFPPRGPVSRFLNRLSGNLCRLFYCDPVHYRKNHNLHHNHFGSPKDGEFANFVVSKRLFKALIPFAVFFNFNDFSYIRSMHYERHFKYTVFWTVLYMLFYGTFVFFLYGGLFFAVTVFVTINFAYALDRIRHYSEHNLMPTENQNGARSFGMGFWGLLIGGGPWGQCCHLSHHLAGRLSWYHQIHLHFYIKNLLTPKQREQFLIKPVIGYPKILAKIIKETTF